MSDDSAGADRSAGDWDVYWRGTHANAAHREGGPQEVVLAEFWSELFARYLSGPQPRRMIDLACGSGAVTGYALKVAPGGQPVCVDYSRSALLEVQKRYPRSLCAVADALNTPFPEQEFDLVVSQFGVEYAGPEALLEAGRLVSPGGVLALVVHLHGGGIYRECELNLRAVEAVQKCGIMPLCRAAFVAGFGLNAGRNTPAEFQAAERRFSPTVRALEGILREFGGDVADGLARQLYRDIAHMYRRMSSFEEGEVLAWVDGMVGELAAYAGRMASMTRAALTRDQVATLLAQLCAGGLQVQRRDTLRMGADGEEAGWALVLSR